MALKTPKNRQKPLVFFIGIGGIGISSLARWFLAQNWVVVGSDIIENSITQELRKEGVKVKIGHKKANLPLNAALVIYSIAVPLDNPEITEAKRLGIEIILWEAYLGRMTKDHVTVAVAGSHGKSTTTAMLAAILIEAGYDPTVFFGSKFFPDARGGRTNFRLGKSPFWIIEADEYKDHFLNYRPWAAVITNIEYEHADYFKNEAATRKSFLAFSKKIDKKGFIVLNREDKNSRLISPSINLRKVWFSDKQAKQIALLRKILKVPGKHNVSNALSAWVAAKNLGVPEKKIIAGLSKFPGIWRRLEYRARNSSGTIIYDDYAHHPTEIRASLQGLREKYPDKFLICVFQPHQAKRLKELFPDFVRAFDTADSLILLDVYRVVGRDDASARRSFNEIGSQNAGAERSRGTRAEQSRGINSADLFFAISDFGRPKFINYVSNSRLISSVIKQQLKAAGVPAKKTVVVMMGAGDIVDYTPLLLK